MADTTTEGLPLTKPEPGASRATWGTKWNANADKIGKQFAMFALANAADQTVTSGVVTTVTLETERYDSNAACAANTFTATYTGWYRFRGKVSGSASGGLSRIGVGVLVNGATYYSLEDKNGLNGTSANGVASGEDEIYLTANDTVVMQGVVTGTGTVKFNGTAPNLCTFSGQFMHS